MAEEEKEEGQEEKKGGAKNKMLIIIIAAVLVLLLVIGGVVAFLMMGGDEAPADQTPQQEAAAKTKKPTKVKTDLLNIGPIYPLDQVIVNLLSQSGRRYLKTTLNLEISNEALQAEIDLKKAVIKDTVITVLSQKTIEEISTTKGKEKLKEELMERLNEFLVDGQVVNIFFTDFVIQ